MVLDVVDKKGMVWAFCSGMGMGALFSVVAYHIELLLHCTLCSNALSLEIVHYGSKYISGFVQHWE